jgi:hypothetical protein
MPDLTDTSYCGFVDNVDFNRTGKKSEQRKTCVWPTKLNSEPLLMISTVSWDREWVQRPTRLSVEEVRSLRDACNLFLTRWADPIGHTNASPDPP